MDITLACVYADTLLTSARLWVRRCAPSLDEELRQTIASGLLDLHNNGVARIDPADPLIQQALKFYVKGYFGYDSDSEKWREAYEKLKISLSLNGEYNKVVAIDDG